MCVFASLGLLLASALVPV